MMLFVDLFKGNHSVEFIWLPMFSTQITRHKRLKKKEKVGFSTFKCKCFKTNIGNYLGRHTSH